MSDTYFNIRRSECKHPELHDLEWDIFYEHFVVFPWDGLPSDARGFELGCGTGLWTQLIAQRAGHVVGLDHRIEEVEKAREYCELSNVEFRESDFFNIGSIEADSMDFGIALETLHCSSDVGKTVRNCAQKLKPGAPLLIYLLFEPETPLGRLRAKASDLRYRLERGQKMDKRYKKVEVRNFMKDAGLETIQFSPVGSYWTAVGYKAS